jgi:hypothetical protein
MTMTMSNPNKVKPFDFSRDGAALLVHRKPHFRYCLSSPLLLTLISIKSWNATKFGGQLPTFNVQLPTSKSKQPSTEVRFWMLDVECWKFGFLHPSTVISVMIFPLACPIL